MRADLAHQEHFLPLALEALAHPDFGFAPVVFPTVVEKINAASKALSTISLAVFKSSASPR